MRTLKSIDGKSLLIGGLLASTIFFAMGATSKTDAGKWDNEQVWNILTSHKFYGDKGWEPFVFDHDAVRIVDGVEVKGGIIWRKRFK